MNQAMIQLISGMVGVLGFSIVFGVRPRLLPWTVLGGGIACLIMLLCQPLQLFAANAAAAFGMTVYCECMARIKKVPVVGLMIPSITVLVPGSALYYTVSYLLARNNALAGAYAWSTATICLGIAAGVLVASVCVSATLALHVKVARKN